MIKRFMAVVLCFIFVSLLFSETIYLEDGKKLQGQITEETENYIILENENRWEKIKKENIIKIEKGEKPKTNNYSEELKWRKEIDKARKTRTTWEATATIFACGGLIWSSVNRTSPSWPDVDFTGPIILSSISLLSLIPYLSANSEVKSLEKEGFKKEYKMYPEWEKEKF